ncbi:MAG TPA: hypothetical protein VIL86_03595 [Tepidisphaeraceae bacterium]|jgi:hypothetical protein
MRRKLFNLLAAISLLLCVATVVLWVAVGDNKLHLLDNWNHPDTTFVGGYLRLAGALTPYWLVVALTAPLPLLWAASNIFNARERRRLARVGLCPVCGYDLRATPARCPECGTPAPSPPPTIA